MANVPGELVCTPAFKMFINEIKKNISANSEILLINYIVYDFEIVQYKFPEFP
ncbi:hypothetical protein SAMN03080602_00856 [Arenibacter troitsensis]|uniref:Uncharacterized protein n=1 Tax=Arenibacter troitsensis TaxID=188872 RepID=A0A1X7IHU2_9FLAO|nr:hypothetical protein SAMN03080602_00856 [Arenibacter troitsensis]